MAFVPQVVFALRIADLAIGENRRHLLGVYGSLPTDQLLQPPYLRQCLRMELIRLDACLVWTNLPLIHKSLVTATGRVKESPTDFAYH